MYFWKLPLEMYLRQIKDRLWGTIKMQISKDANWPIPL